MLGCQPDKHGKTKGTAVLTNPNLYVNYNHYLTVAIRLCADVSRVRPVSTRLKEAEARFAGYITRDDCSAPVRGADPLRQKRAHAQRPGSRADRRLDRISSELPSWHACGDVTDNTVG